MERFTSLDAFRGAAALGVAIYHWAIFAGGAHGLPADNLYLFIDFFFVLSGFIIAAMYRDQIGDGAMALRFLLLRLARVYPVHVFMLAAFLAVASISALVGGAALTEGALTVEGFVAHLLLIQPAGQAAGWNQPAWTISVEMQLCVLFALLCLAGVMRSALGRLSLAVAAVATLYYLATRHGDLNITHADAFGRGFVGFTAGVLLHSVTMTRRAAQGLAAMKRRAGLGIEVAALVCVVVYLALAEGAASFAAPVVFAALIFVFLDNTGPVSRYLLHPLFQRFGALSYGIFMAHFLFIPPMQTLYAGQNVTPLAIAVGLLAYLALTIGLASCLHRLLETPTRNAMRAWIDQRVPSKYLAIRVPDTTGWTPPPRRR